MTKMDEAHTLWGRTYVYSPYKGVSPPGTFTVPLLAAPVVLENLMLVVALRWASIKARRNTQSLHASETGINSGLMG